MTETANPLALAAIQTAREFIVQQVGSSEFGMLQQATELVERLAAAGVMAFHVREVPQPTPDQLLAEMAAADA